MSNPEMPPDIHAYFEAITDRIKTLLSTLPPGQRPQSQDELALWLSREYPDEFQFEVFDGLLAINYTPRRIKK